MRRWWISAGVMVVVAAAGVWLAWRPAPSASTALGGTRPLDTTTPRPSRLVLPRLATKPTRPHPERVTAVADACDLPLRSRCDERGCATLAVMPDLDGPLGWVHLIAGSPRFVISTALRDLGVAPEAMPCGGAIAALVATGAASSVELPDGTEVWCAAEGDGALAVCDALAREHVGPEAERFTADGLRQLRFAPDG